MALAFLISAIGGHSLNAQTYNITSSVLVVDGQFVGYVTDVAGGFAEGVVVEETPAEEDAYVAKHLDSQPNFENITFVVRAGMKKTFYDWVVATLSRNYTRHDGAIVRLDQNGKPVRTLEFDDTQIVGVAFSRLDASSQQPVAMSVKLSPVSSFTTAGGTVVSGASCNEGRLFITTSGSRLAVST